MQKEWHDDLMWIAYTLQREAEKATFQEQLGIAWVIVNNMFVSKLPAHHISLCLDPYNFHDAIDESKIGKEYYKPACTAYFEVGPDTSRGALYFVGPKTQLHILPPLNSLNLTTVIGDFSFYKK